MGGDYYRYMAEFANESQKKSYAEQAHQYYLQGFTDAQTAMNAFHPIRLGLVLNYSVFLHEVQGQTDVAISTATAASTAATTAYQAAYQSGVTEASLQESLTTLTLIAD